MIPKVIHYTWFSGEPFPDKIQKCIDSWHKYMPEYEYICWNSEKIKEFDCIWLDESLKARKWAFAADYVRLSAIYKYGGIYLDTDCLVLQSFDSFLDDNCFIGKENSIHVEGRSTQMYLTSHCFGAEKGNHYIFRCLSFYKDRHFKLSDDDSLPMKLKYSAILLPFIQSEIAKQSGYNPYPSCITIQRLDDVVIYPPSYFDTTNNSSKSFCRHLAMGAWRDSKTAEESPTIRYKIRWRIEKLVNTICNYLGYYLIKKL